MPKYQDLYHRLLAWIDEPANEQACWVHKGASNKKGGYVRVNVKYAGMAKARQAYAHVLMWEWFNGPRPEGHDVDHMCHNHRCVNPDHLQALTYKDNRSKNQWTMNCSRGYN